MYRVALNTAITAFKKASRHPLGNHPVESVNFQLAAEEYDYEFEENLKLLHKAIEQLTGVEKSIILLYLEDKKYDEIAEITGITQNYVRVKMNRIKKKLKAILNVDA
jgi:RNA polymerase sigma-70 factor, ECF subfamily